MNDDYSLDVFWHALNYRTAATQHAQEAWTELKACVERIKAAERERCAKACERRAEDRFNERGIRESDTNYCYYSGSQADYLETCDEEDRDCAAAIRALPPTD